MVKNDVRRRRPNFFTRSISALCRRKRRRDEERPGISGIRPKDDRYTAKRARPFARRRARTFRPFLVLMRLRNPWSLFRFRFEGCLNVADMQRLQYSKNRVASYRRVSHPVNKRRMKALERNHVPLLWRFCCPAARRPQRPRLPCAPLGTQRAKRFEFAWVLFSSFVALRLHYPQPRSCAAFITEARSLP